METEYRRNNGRSYMIVKSEIICNRYDVQMIQNNFIKGLLPLEVIVGDDKEQYWYDISGYQSFDNWIRDRKAGASELKNVVTSLSEVMGKLEKFLLFEEAISMNPEDIFISGDGRQVAFCYRPMLRNGGIEALGTFMEFYLTIMDHSDRSGAQNCYKAYEKCRDENVTIGDIIDCFSDDVIEETDDQNVNIIEEYENKETEKIKVYSSKKDKIKPFLDIKPMKFFKRDEKEKRSIVYELPKERMYVAEPKGDQELAYDNPGTVLLGMENSRILGRLIYQGFEDVDSFIIDKDEFIVGNSIHVDGKIVDDTVSRKHARITKRDQKYLIEDLNSKNGTYVNDEIVNYKEIVELNKNDRIRFADCEYLLI